MVQDSEWKSFWTLTPKNELYFKTAKCCIIYVSLLLSSSDIFALCSFLFINNVSFPSKLLFFAVFCSGMDVKAYLRSMIPHLESGMKSSKSKDMYVLNFYDCISKDMYVLNC